MMICQMWWYTPVIPALRRMRQEDYQLKASLGYIDRPCLNHPPKNDDKGYEIQ
jgi:hypothetical protein